MYEWHYLLFARQFLGLLQVEKAILDLCAQYLRIVMISMIFSYIYNYLASILRALGDSRSPLYFLAISSILNIFGDLLLSLSFKWVLMVLHIVPHVVKQSVLYVAGSI